jgi:1,4-dihydroxy-2-naphthoate octaprenyltransferase
VTVATFMASFQSPFTAYLGETKGSGSYLYLLLASFACLVTAAVLGIVEVPVSFLVLIVGIVLALSTYINLFSEDAKVSLFTDA